MPDNWLSIVRSASHDFYSDSNRFHRSPGLGISERQQDYVVCHRPFIGASPLFYVSFSRSLPGLRLQWMITAHLLGFIIRTEVPPPGYVDFLPSCYQNTYDSLRLIAPRHHLFHQCGDPAHAQFRACWNSKLR
jgi:hypothetical protein